MIWLYILKNDLKNKNAINFYIILSNIFSKINEYEIFQRKCYENWKTAFYRRKLLSTSLLPRA